MILAAYISAAMAVATSLLVGRAVMAGCGRSTWTGIEPAVGFAAIMTLLGLLARFPGNREALLLGFAAICLLSVYVLVTLQRRRPSAISVIRSPWFWGTVAVTALLTAVPFLISDRWGLLGMGYNNDLGLHLAWAEFLRSGFGTEPSAGYPLGPHGLAATLSFVPGLSLNPAFIGVLIAIPVLTAMTAWSAFASLGPRRRLPAAVLVALSYLMASYFAQAAFKEIATAMLLLAFTIALPGCLPLPGGRSEKLKVAGPLLILMGGILFTFSFPGLAFPAVVTAAWLLFDPVFRQRIRPANVAALVRRPLVLAGTAVGILVLLVFAFAGPLGFGSAFSQVSGSDAFGPVSAVETFGVWLTSDYRLDGQMSTPMPVLMGAIAVLAVLVSLLWWQQRPRTIYPIALIAVAALYLVSLPWVGDYSLAKALVIGSPIAMVTVLTALMSDPAAASGGRRRLWRWARVTFGVVFITLASVSSLLVLRDASVAPPGRAAELIAFRGEVAGKRVLYGDQDRFAPGYFPESTVSLPLKEFPEPDVTADRKKPFETGFGQNTIDFDTFDASTLNSHDYVVTTAAPWASKPPPSFKLIDRTPSYMLWKRTGQTFDRPNLKENSAPAKRIDCNSEIGRYLSEQEGEAVVMPESVVGLADDWLPASEIAPGHSSTIELELGKGRWRISIQYFTPGGMTLSAAGYSRAFAPAIDGQRISNQPSGSYGQFWPAGLIDVPRAGQVEFTARGADPSPLQRLTGYSLETKLGRIALMRVGTRRRVPLSEICGQWVDFYRLSDPKTAPQPSGGGDGVGSVQAGTGSG